MSPSDTFLFSIGDLLEQILQTSRYDHLGDDKITNAAEEFAEFASGRSNETNCLSAGFARENKLSRFEKEVNGVVGGRVRLFEAQPAGAYINIIDVSLINGACEYLSATTTQIRRFQNKHTNDFVLQWIGILSNCN